MVEFVEELVSESKEMEENESSFRVQCRQIRSVQLVGWLCCGLTIS